MSSNASTSDSSASKSTDSVAQNSATPLDLRKKEDQPFNTILGYAPGNVPAYSNGEFFSMERHIMHGLYMGIKWQCVEFARRWAFLKHGLFFGQIPHAGQVFEKLQYVRRLPDCKQFTVTPRPNGSPTAPSVDSLILWPQSDLNPWGHIGVITAVILNDSKTSDNLSQSQGQVGVVRLGEQNKFDTLWEGEYSRELPIVLRENLYYIQDDECAVQGWMEIEGIEDHKPIELKETDVDKIIDILGDENDTGVGRHWLKRNVSPAPKDAPQDWLDKNNSAEASWMEIYGPGITRPGQNEIPYYHASRDFLFDLATAANELHRNFLEGTSQTIESDELLRKCAIPVTLWPKVRKSWAQHQRHFLLGRFDFGYDGKTLKVFEYNADNAGLLLEAAVIQAKWEKAASVEMEGFPACRLLHGRVVDRFKLLKADILRHELAFFEKHPFAKQSGIPKEASSTEKAESAGSSTKPNEPMPLVHVFFNPENLDDKTSALYMGILLTEAGFRSKLTDHLWKLHKQDGTILDEEGEAIRTIWKTWSWSTVFDRYEALQSNGSMVGQIDLSEVLLSDDIMVFEPLWKAVLANKALFPLLSKLYPHNPHLLPSSFELTPEHKEVVHQTHFATKEFEGGWFASVGAWMMGDWFSGILIREDKKGITDSDSPVAACRIVWT